MTKASTLHLIDRLQYPCLTASIHLIITAKTVQSCIRPIYSGRNMVSPTYLGTNF